MGQDTSAFASGDDTLVLGTSALSHKGIEPDLLTAPEVARSVAEPCTTEAFEIGEIAFFWPSVDFSWSTFSINERETFDDDPQTLISVLPHECSSAAPLWPDTECGLYLDTFSLYDPHVVALFQ